MKVNRAVFSGCNFRLMLYPNVFLDKEYSDAESAARIAAQNEADNLNRIAC
jgi:hypothetical protein